MIRDDEGLGAATWLISAAAATLILILIWLLATLWGTLWVPSVWLWLLDAEPTIPLLLVMFGVISVWWPR